ISEGEMLEALRFASQHIEKLCELQLELRRECGKPKREIVENSLKKQLFPMMAKIARDDVRNLTHRVLLKEERSLGNEEIRQKALAALKAEIGSAGLVL